MMRILEGAGGRDPWSAEIRLRTVVADLNTIRGGLTSRHATTHYAGWRPAHWPTLVGYRSDLVRARGSRGPARSASTHRQRTAPRSTAADPRSRAPTPSA